MMIPPFEDDLTDILKKAAIGHRMGIKSLAQASGLQTHDVEALLEGRGSEADLMTLAKPLELDADKLCRIRAKERELVEPSVEGVTRVTQPFLNVSYPNAFVNSYLIGDPAGTEIVAFDTGCLAKPILDRLRALNKQLVGLFLTHDDRDHAGGFFELQKVSGEGHSFSPVLERLDQSRPVSEGDVFEYAGLRIRATVTEGHTVGGISYLVENLSKPVMVVGDAILPNTIGGPRFGYQLAIDRVKDKILSLPDETVLCAGHGPITTVGAEKFSNPFF